MNKNRIRLTESQLHRVIKESVNRVLKEGHSSSAVYDEFSRIRAIIGDETLISALYNWLDADSIEEFITHINRMYKLENDDF